MHFNIVERNRQIFKGIRKRSTWRKLSERASGP